MRSFYPENPTQLWAELLIEELVRCGADHFFVAPGSRSLPLTLAAARNPRAEVLVHPEERGLGYWALGWAAAGGGVPVVVVTSGTAAANLLPAVCEFSKKKCPAVFLTADRPWELRETGANQTLDQVKLFGSHVRFFFDVPAAEDSPSALDRLPALLTLVDSAVSRAKDPSWPGPVHLNVMLREPLALETAKKRTLRWPARLNDWIKEEGPLTRFPPSQVRPTASGLDEAAARINAAERGVIVTGKLAGPEDREAVLRLAEHLRWPIWPDITSGLRGQGGVSDLRLAYFDLMLQAVPEKISQLFPQRRTLFLHIGGRLTSWGYNRWIAGRDQREILTVLPHPLRHDPTHAVSFRLQARARDLDDELLARLRQRRPLSALNTLQTLNRRVEKILETVCAPSSAAWAEPTILRWAAAGWPASYGVFLGNSLPIRLADGFWPASHPEHPFGANRGTSGIDGNIASAAGMARALKRPVMALVGDLTLWHDMASLELVRSSPVPMTVLVLNNNGGGIFSFLSAGRLEKGYEKEIFTPHQVNFQKAAEVFGLRYACPANPDELRQRITQCARSKKSWLIEVKTQRQANERFVRALIHTIRREGCRVVELASRRVGRGGKFQVPRSMF